MAMLRHVGKRCCGSCVQGLLNLEWRPPTTTTYFPPGALASTALPAFSSAGPKQQQQQLSSSKTTTSAAHRAGAAAPSTTSSGAAATAPGAATGAAAAAAAAAGTGGGASRGGTRAGSPHSGASAAAAGGRSLRGALGATAAVTTGLAAAAAAVTAAAAAAQASADGAAAAAEETEQAEGPSSLLYDRRDPGDQNPYSHPDPDQMRDAQGLPILMCPKATAPRVPPPISRTHPAHLVLELTTTTRELSVSPLHKYTFWTFDGTVPGPFMRGRVGDVLEVRYTNKDSDGIGHNIDFHAVEGPGGGAPVLYAEEGETKVATFKLLVPGLFVYHCSAAPLPTHIANGMYGMFLVEPEGGLPPVDREYYVLQSEVYAEESETPGLLDHSYFQGLAEAPLYVVLNGAQGELTEKGPLLADQDDNVRIYFGNIGPNLVSALHVIGTTFRRLYREGDLLSPPAQYVQTTCVPPGGACVVDLHLPVPGNYTLVDHAIFRVDKGCVGFLKVRARGPDRRRDLYDSLDPPNPCPGCKLHG